MSRPNGEHNLDAIVERIELVEASIDSLAKRVAALEPNPEDPNEPPSRVKKGL